MSGKYSMQRIIEKINQVFRSRRCTHILLGFFVFEAAWVACSAVYPMAFDEDFHFGIIKIYAHHWIPFLSDAGIGNGKYGALNRDPSYLYHWLMSFPYRIISILSGKQAVQIIALRCINIVLFTLGLWLFVKVMRKAGTSRGLANALLALFVLIPIVPLLAGQINYDNLLMPVVAGLCLLTFKLYDGFQKQQIDLKAFTYFVCLCLLGSLVKYAFLPMAAAATCFLVVIFARNFWRQGLLRSRLRQGYGALSMLTKIGLIVFLLVSSILFVQRYGMNLSAYHTPVPACDTVLTPGDCQSYGPWARNYIYTQNKESVSANPLSYSWLWLQGMHYRLFFMINGPASGFLNYPPSPLPSAAAICFGVCALIATLLYARKVFNKRPLLIFLTGMSVLYITIVWADNFSQYLETGQPVAVNGRYLLPVLLPLGVVAGRGLNLALRLWPNVKPVIAGLAVACFLQGGGVIGFITRSDSSWDWPSRPIVTLNNSVRSVLSPLVLEGNKYF